MPFLGIPFASSYSTMLLQIDHTTEYRYRRTVGLTPHLLRFHPRGVPGLRILRSELRIHPVDHSLRWSLDAEGNVLGMATFPGESDLLRIESSLLLEQRITNPFDFLIEGRAIRLPLSYDDRERQFLAPFLQPSDPGSAKEVMMLLEPFLRGISAKDSTLDFLTAFNRAIPALFRYSLRHEPGVQSAEETITRREGTCRDFAHLFIESARSAGLAARYVGGYLCSSPGTLEENHTHAWCEVYLPGAGWRGFDPTNGILADAHHVAVATSPTAGDIPPVEGSYCGEGDLLEAHDVVIRARELIPGEEEAA
ncbi:MAG: transglutaminase family protein [Proteobacteria bacterium]|nr:transglutaminase family protein [Pseudomonadota bacterium]